MYVRAAWPYCLTLKFGYGHPVRFPFAQVFFRRHKRYLAFHLLLLVGLAACAAAALARRVRGARPINPYTKRGIRCGRQRTMLRRGKESQYTKLKSKIF